MENDYKDSHKQGKWEGWGYVFGS